MLPKGEVPAAKECYGSMHRSFSLLNGSYLAAAETAAWGGTPPVKPVEESSSEGQAQTSADSAVKEGSGVVGRTPTEPLEKSSDTGSPKF